VWAPSNAGRAVADQIRERGDVSCASRNRNVRSSRALQRDRIGKTCVLSINIEGIAVVEQCGEIINIPIDECDCAFQKHGAGQHDIFSPHFANWRCNKRNTQPPRGSYDTATSATDEVLNLITLFPLFNFAGSQKELSVRF
jgi:hypothetical protein